mmetsp:Transcript_36160/g.108240  ORF Transcript_36160/g.108240 Transcript_36160/m.108240 type:complete len:241 (-) Transcript_36160:592-1314(-)
MGSSEGKWITLGFLGVFGVACVLVLLFHCLTSVVILVIMVILIFVTVALSLFLCTRFILRSLPLDSLTRPSFLSLLLVLIPSLLLVFILLLLRRKTRAEQPGQHDQISTVLLPSRRFGKFHVGARASSQCISRPQRYDFGLLRILFLLVVVRCSGGGILRFGGRSTLLLLRPRVFLVQCCVHDVHNVRLVLLISPILSIFATLILVLLLLLLCLVGQFCLGRFRLPCHLQIPKRIRGKDR